tara:strand:+ start:810 stop:1481 length:672 start_codon:yes stop_codon:yes gene_type:complete
MNEFVYQRKSKSDLFFNDDRKIETEFLEEGSRDLYDIIKFCCAVKENPLSPNLKEWSRKEYSSNLNSMVYDNPVSENGDHDEQTKKLLSYAQRAQIYAMTSITALNSGDGEKAVWNAIRSQKYVSQIQEMIKITSAKIDRSPQNNKGSKIQSLRENDVEANDLIDEFEKLIRIHDSYGAFRRLAAKKLGVPAIKVTIKEINEITKQVHKAYEFNPKRRRTDKM